MEKNIKDYLPLYLGSQYRYRYIDYQPSEWVVWAELNPERLYRVLNDHSISEIQLELRPLSDMTEEEGKQYVSLGFGGLPVMKDKQRIIYTTFTPPCLNWLRKMGFDCDELIESGLAIDKTKQSLLSPN